MKKILVTGGAGFIGYNIAKIASESANNEVHIVDNLSKGVKDNEFNKLIEKSNVQFYEKDLTDLNTFDEIEPKYDKIYHLAAVVGVRAVTDNPDLTIKTNTLSTIYLLEYIKNMSNNPKILFASSCENYAGTINAFNVAIPTSEDVPLCIDDVNNPRWAYAASKILGEVACIQYSKKHSLRTTIVRYHNVYGPRMGTQHVIPEFILRLKIKPMEFEMFGGNQYRTFCYVTDAAKMTINLMENIKADGRVINIGNGYEMIRISSIAKEIAKIMKINPKFVEKGAPKGSVVNRKPDITLIKDLGNYVSEVSFPQGLNNTLDWYTSRY